MVWQYDVNLYLYRPMLRFCLAFVFMVFCLSAQDGYILSEMGANTAVVVAESRADILTMPGSVFKPLLAWYFLEKVAGFNPETKIFCPGWSGRVRGVERACWFKPGHRWLNLGGAIQQSCNYYFYRMAASLSVESFFNYLYQEFSFPLEVKARGSDSFLGDNLSRPLSLREIAEVMHRLYFKLKTQDLAAKTIWLAMQQARFGTLTDINQSFAKQKHFKLLAGKTGTVRTANFSAGLVFLILERMHDGTKYTLLYYRPNLMGGKIPGKYLLNLLNKKVR